jgi:hypothetical protein
MRRTKLVFATLVVLVAALAAFSGPAMAQDDLNCRDARGELIRCDGELYAPYNAYSYNDYYDDYNDYLPFYNDYSPFYGPFDSPFYNYADYEDYDEFEDAVDDYLDSVEDNSWYYCW